MLWGVYVRIISAMGIALSRFGFFMDRMLSLIRLRLPGFGSLMHNAVAILTHVLILFLGGGENTA